MFTNPKQRKLIAACLLVICGLLLVYALFPYSQGVLGAIVLYFLLLPLHKLFSKRIPAGISATFVILISLLIIIIPLTLLVISLLSQVNSLFSSEETVYSLVEQIPFEWQGQSLNEVIAKYQGQILSGIQSFIASGFSQVSSFFINMVVLYFLLFFMLVGHQKLNAVVIDLLPFNTKNSSALIAEARNMTYATVYGTGILAFIQGFLVGLSFFFVGLNAPVLWGFVATIVAFLPVVGTPLVLVPGIIYLFLHQSYVSAAILIVCSLIIVNCDNFLRPYIQKKIAEVHPLVSIVGVLIGVPLFGIVGIVFGPLLISFFVLVFRFYREEYS